MEEDQMKLLFSIIMCFSSLAFGDTDPNDLKILMSFQKGLENPELLKWPSNDNNPCGPPLWPHVFCVGSRVSQIQVQNLSLSGTLPQNFNQLTKLVNLGFQRNNFVGKLPSFSGLSELRYAYLGYNQFDTIPSDFFDGLTSLQVLSLDYNPLNKTTGWTIPITLRDSSQLMNLSLMECNLIDHVPDFLGEMPSLTALKLSYNNLSGELPASFSGSELQILWLNNQYGTMLSGDINAIASMVSLEELWLHGNSFTGKIPMGITSLSSLTDLQLNDNHFVGPIPPNITDMNLKTLKVEHNMLNGPIPKLNSTATDFSGNSFCQTSPGVPCSPEVTALLDFLDNVNYPSGLASTWSGNVPCGNSWLGITCSSENKVSVVNLPNLKLNGTLSPSLGKLDSVEKIMLAGNHLSGKIPVELTSLKSLKVLDLTGNNLNPPVPKFNPGVSVLTEANPLLSATSPSESPPSGNSPPSENTQPPSNNLRSPPTSATTPTSNTSVIVNPSNTGGSNNSKTIAIVAPAVGFALLCMVSLFLYYCFCRKKKSTFQTPSSFVVHPRDPSEPDDIVKIAIAHNINGSLLNQSASCSQSINSGLTRESQVIEAGNLVISVEVLRAVTDNFAPENVLGQGGFGVVYKGVFLDGTIIAVKRMEATTVSNKALDEFEAEIAVLSKVRHRHLVSLLGYSIEGNERLLVYEYMPQGALSKHLFHWERLNLEPLSWKRRLNIALDVARGMEYLHSMAHQSFIHRDLKSSNILLGDDLHAKVSDFGLVKLAPDGKKSVATRLAGTFGYLAPEYAVTGKITTKADVFSFGIVLMELVTGLTALDEDRPEEKRYLAQWFWQVKSRKETLRAAVDPVLDVTEETFESISIIAELAGHCTAREPKQRPNMGHVVTVLSPQIEKWKPVADDEEEYSGIDYSQPLTLMVKDWQAAESMDHSFSGLDDSKGSIPARPTGFAESFTSADGR